MSLPLDYSNEFLLFFYTYNLYHGGKKCIMENVYNLTLWKTTKQQLKSSSNSENIQKKYKHASIANFTYDMQCMNNFFFHFQRFPTILYT